METMAFDDDRIAVVRDSQLDTLTRLNLVASIQYANVLLHELEVTIATCTINTPTNTPARNFEQIHALKNIVSATGCQPLLAACMTLQSRAPHETHRAELRSAFIEIAQAAQRLITTYLSRLA